MSQNAWTWPQDVFTLFSGLSDRASFCCCIVIDLFNWLNNWIAIGKCCSFTNHISCTPWWRVLELCRGVLFILRFCSPSGDNFNFYSSSGVFIRYWDIWNWLFQYPCSYVKQHLHRWKERSAQVGVLRSPSGRQVCFNITVTIRKNCTFRFILYSDEWVQNKIIKYKQA